jgi:predicted nucleotide-binding protein
MTLSTSAKITRDILDILKSGMTGVEFFLSEHIEPGDNWRSDIVKAIKAADCQLLLYLDPDQDWSWCMFEAGLFSAYKANRERRLYCIQYPGSPPLDRHSEIQTTSATLDSMKRFLNSFYMTTKQTDPNTWANVDVTASRLVDFLHHVTAEVNKKVFIVHGHDSASKDSVARFLYQLGVEPIILHEQASQGNTVIEKFERHSDVHFAVVLLTPDDLGSSALRPAEALPRARQNVIFELGYFVGRLGRQRVCALHKGNVEIPSDYHGVAYLSLDDAGAWKLSLVRDMKAAGFGLDMNRAL